MSQATCWIKKIEEKNFKFFPFFIGGTLMIFLKKSHKESSWKIIRVPPMKSEKNMNFFSSIFLVLGILIWILSQLPYYILPTKSLFNKFIQAKSNEVLNLNFWSNPEKTFFSSCGGNIAYLKCIFEFIFIFHELNVK